MRVILANLEQDKLFLEASIDPNRIASLRQMSYSILTIAESNIPLLTISVASVAPMRRDHMTMNMRSVLIEFVGSKMQPTISDNNSSASGDTVDAVDQHSTSRGKSLVDELAGRRKMYQEIGILDVFYADAFMTDARFWDLCRNRIIAHR